MYALATVFDGMQSSYSTGVAKIVAELRGSGRRREVLAALATATAFSLALGAAVLAVSVAIALLGDGLSPAGLLQAFQVGMIALGAATLVRLVGSTYAAAMLGYQRYDLFNTARLVAAIWLGVATVAAVEAGAGLEGAALALASSLLVEAIMFARLMRRMDSSLPLRPHLGDAASRRRIASFSSYVLLADAAISISRLQPVVIAAVRNAAAAAPFSAAVKLQTALQSAVYPFVDLLIPMVSDLQSRGRAEEVARRLLLGTRAALQVALPLAAGIALFSEDIVSLWLGPDAPAVTGEIIVILMTVQVATLTATPAVKVLVGLGQVRITAVMLGIEGASNLVLTILLVSEYGVLGAALSLLITGFLFSPVMVRLACRATRISSVCLVRQSLWPAVASSLPGLFAMVAVFAALPESAGRLTLGIFVGVGTSLAVAVAQVGAGRLRMFFGDLVGRPV
jgi:O-antigen/teichoic acid export membrane protein